MHRAKGSPEKVKNERQQDLITLDKEPSTASEQKKFAQEEANDVDFVETEQEEELVEDQFLPSDSQLKSGLEFLFLKQQKRKWLARHSRKK